MNRTSRTDWTGKQSLLQAWQLAVACLLILVALTFSVQCAQSARKLSDREAKIERYKEAGIEAFKQKKPGDAEELFRQALSIAGEAREYCKQRSEILLDLSTVYESNNQHDKAQEMVAQAIALTRSTWGRESARLPPLLNKLADLCADQQKKCALLRESLKIREATVGKSDPSLMITIGRLSAVTQGDEQLDYRIRFYQIRKRLPGFKSNSNSSQIASAIASSYIERRAWKEAALYAREASDLAASFYGKNSPLCQECLIMQALAKQGLKGQNTLEAVNIAAPIYKLKTARPIDEHLLDALAGSATLFAEAGDRKHAAELFALLLERAHHTEDCSGSRLLQIDLAAVESAAANGETERAKFMLKTYSSDVHRLISGKQAQARELESARFRLKSSRAVDLLNCLN